MTDLDWNKFFSQNPQDNTEFFGQLATPIKNAVCQLYSQSPNWVTNLPQASAHAVGLDKYLFDQLCPNTPIPAPPTTPPPFTGGQCSKVPYKAIFHINPNNGYPDDPSVENGQINCFGPISGMGNATNCGNGQFGKSLFASDNSGNPHEYNLFCVPDGYAYPPIYKLLRVERTDGQPDNCGDPSSNPPPPPKPPDQYFNTTNNITLSNGQTLQMNTKILYNPTTIQNQNQVNIPLQISLGGDTNNYIPITISPGNVNINLSGDGQNYQSDGQAGNILSGNNLNNIINNFNALGVAVGGVAGALVPITTVVNNNQKLIQNVQQSQAECCKKKTPNSGKYTAHKFGPTEGAVFENIDNLAYVEITLNNPDVNLKPQSGSGSSPTVYIQGGWFSWMEGSFCGVRHPLDFEFKQFICPDFCNGFLVSASHFGNVSGTYYVTNT